MVRSSFSTLFFIRENRVRKDGTTIIEVLITVNGERCGFSTGKKVKAKLYQKEAELLGRGFIITAKLLCEAYQEKIESLKEKSLFEVFTEHNHEQEKLIGNGGCKLTVLAKLILCSLLTQFNLQPHAS